MIIVDLLQSLIFFIFALLLGYQTLLCLLAFRAKKTVDFSAKSHRRFAFVVPAHNEEKIISKTVYSLFGIIYPKQLYDVFVVADNCTDNTAGIARGLGATVLERQDENNRGKGYALRWAFDKILAQNDKYDAVIVVDSDSLISGNYLEVMNYYLEQGSRVIQSSDLVLPNPGNWSSEATRIGFILYNYVKPLGRKVLNFNMGLRGNGMCFKTDVLKEVPWKAWSLIEDVEYGLILMLNDVKIDFAPEAFVWAQMPVKASNAVSQRTRWELGRYQIMKNYIGRFYHEALQKRSLKHFDVLIDLITPPFVNMMLVIALICLTNLLFWYWGFISILFFNLWGILLFTGLFYLFAGLYIAGADRNLYKSLLFMPVYICWKIKVYIKSLFKGRETDWIRTTRDL